VYALGLSWLVPTVPIGSYLTLQLKANGFGTFETNLLTIPAYVLFIVNLLFFSWLSEKLNERFLLATISQWWALPLLIALEVLPADRNPWVAWALSVLLYAMPYFHAIIVAVTSRNAGSVRTRTVASAIYNMTVQASNIYGNRELSATPLREPC
jgi:signal transduction histidine kinase